MCMRSQSIIKLEAKQLYQSLKEYVTSAENLNTSGDE